MTRTFTGTLLVLLFCSTQIIQAQNQPDPNLASLFGTIELQTGFTPDPHESTLAAGGRFDLTTVGYSGFVASPPDINLSYTAGDTYDLIIKVRGNSGEDTVLLINTPDGQWHFNDDYENLDPGIEFPNPQTGVYNIWIGTYSGGTTRATIMITETLRSNNNGTNRNTTPNTLPSNNITTYANTPTFTSAPIAGEVTLDTGFTPDPWEKDILAGGSFDLSQMNFSGYTSNAPDFKLHYTAGSRFKLLIKTKSDEDTVLLIRAPDGSWQYNDDYENLNAGILFERPQTGTYTIWVGTYETNMVQSKLIITEVLR